MLKAETEKETEVAVFRNQTYTYGQLLFLHINNRTDLQALSLTVQQESLAVSDATAEPCHL